MVTAIVWIIVGVLNIVTSVLNKYTHESKGKTAYWDGVVCGLNVMMIFAWICRLCGWI